MDDPFDQRVVTRRRELISGHAQHPQELIGPADEPALEVDLPAAHLGEPLGLVLERLAPLQLLAGPPGAVELEVGPDAGKQLSRAERLDQVVVGAGLEAFDDALLSGPGGDHDDRNMERRRVLMERFEQAKAVQSRHHHVGQHEVGWVGPRELEGGLAVRSGSYVVRLAEQGGDVVTHVRVVVGHEHARSLRSAGEFRRAPGGRPALEPPIRLGEEARRLPLDGDLAREFAQLVGPEVLAAERELNRERRADSGSALHRRAAAVQLGELGDERETDPRSLVSPRAGVEHAVEAFEQLLLLDPDRFRSRCQLTRSRAMPSCSSSATVIEPVKVNFSALERRLRTIFAHISRSTYAGSESGSASMMNLRPARFTAESNIEASSAVYWARSTASKLGVVLPDSSREKSSNVLTSFSSRSALRAMISSRWLVGLRQRLVLVGERVLRRAEQQRQTECAARG